MSRLKRLKLKRKGSTLDILRQVRRGSGMLIAVVLCLLMIFTVACGSSDSGSATETTASGDSSTSTAATAPAGSDAATPANAATSAASPSATSSDVTLTVYSGQHEDLAKALATGFEEASGIKVDVRAGSDADLANQIIEEGDRSKADLFMTEEPSQAGAIDGQGLFSPVDPATLDKIDPRFNPESGNWLAYAARSRVIFYNPTIISEEDLPKSILDLTKPEWKGKFAYAPSGAFTSTVTYLINTIGEEKTLDWLQGIKENGKNLQKNGAIRDAVEAGQIGFGLSNHYYWYILAQQKGGPDKLTSKVHVMGDKDPGALVLASGVGVLKSSKHQAEAQQFLAWLADPEGGQKVIATTTPQYPLAPGVESTMGLKPLDQLDPPDFDQGSLKDVNKAKELIIEAGIV